jgi:hypothetical protein
LIPHARSEELQATLKRIAHAELTFLIVEMIRRMISPAVLTRYLQQVYSLQRKEIDTSGTLRHLKHTWAWVWRWTGMRPGDNC